MIEARATGLPDVLILETPVYGDGRGSFLECYNERDFARATGIEAKFVQDNYSESLQHVVRGLHYQVERPQGKLVRVLSGEIYDVMVDVRAASPTRGQWHGERLSAASGRMLWIPPGYAHGFLVLSQTAGVFYKTTDYWAPELERSIRWDDPALAIDWPLEGTPVLSAKDARAPRFREAEPIA
jgi:dTDP-4-dehydrorhamnose 3,5-epimerase